MPPLEGWGGGINHVSLLRGHEDEVLDIAFDTVGQRLVSVSADGECVHTMPHTEHIRHLSLPSIHTG